MILRKQIFFLQKIFAAFLILACLAFVLLSGCAQKRQKPFRIGVLSGLDYVATLTDGFKAKMTEFGYVEGKDIVYDVQKTNFDMVAYKRILKKFVADRVDLIFVFPTEASLEAKMATQGTNIPVVFCFANIEDVGLVQSIRKPGKNITGVRYPGPDIAVRRFEIMQELVPQAKRMCIPYQKGYPIVASQLEVLRKPAAASGITLIEMPASNAAELKKLLGAREKSKSAGMDAILFLAEPLAVTPDAFVVMAKFAAKHKIPVGGALMTVEGYESVFGVNVDIVKVGQQGAPIVHKILNGVSAGSIPVASAESFFQINYGAAQKLGIKVSKGLLSSANKIIK